MSRKKNPNIGSSFDDFLKEEGIYKEISAAAIKRSLVVELENALKVQSVTKAEMARRMSTSRSQLDRLFDPDNDKVQLDTLYKAASALGKSLKLELI